MWAKLENGIVTGVSYTEPPTSEAGEAEAGWEERYPDDPAIADYYAEQANPKRNDPDMLNFRMSMLSNSGYLRVTALAAGSPLGMLTVSRLETALAFDRPYWLVVQAIWGQIIVSLPPTDQPTAAEIESWNVVCSRWHIPIAFSGNGMIAIANP